MEVPEKKVFYTTGVRSTLECSSNFADGISVMSTWQEVSDNGVETDVDTDKVIQCIALYIAVF